MNKIDFLVKLHRNYSLINNLITTHSSPIQENEKKNNLSLMPTDAENQSWSFNLVIRIIDMLTDAYIRRFMSNASLREHF